ncbi:MAG TPA: DUF2924 domain-containing protein [Polyangiaceae bacterium]
MRFVVRELAELARMDVQVLRAKYREAFGQATTSRNPIYLRRRLAWWIQWQAEDMFSERILARIAEVRSGARLRGRRSGTRASAAG